MSVSVFVSMSMCVGAGGMKQLCNFSFNTPLAIIIFHRNKNNVRLGIYVIKAQSATEVSYTYTFLVIRQNLSEWIKV